MNGEKGQYLQLVISASYSMVEMTRQEIIDLCLKELRQVLPAAREAKIVKATVIKEINATFSPEPGVDRYRWAESVPGRRLDAHRLALNHGKCRAERLSCVRSAARRIGNSKEFFAGRFAAGRTLEVLGEEEFGSLVASHMQNRPVR